MFTRRLRLPPPGKETFFLWGPRQAGKTTLLQQVYPDARWVDLLKADSFRHYVVRPERLREELESKPPNSDQQVIIDEIQKVPDLLDEVHWLIENRGIRFALCGSSARKVRRGGANLLGGRARRYELHGLTSAEAGPDFHLDHMLRAGFLPGIYAEAEPEPLLDSYLNDYLREEIVAEGLVRSLPAFSDFLDAAALGDGEIVNFTNIARECGVAVNTARGHYEILKDTLLGRWLPAWRRRVKRRTRLRPKFYFTDVGTVNRLARRGIVEAGSEAYGRAFENWVFHEITAWIAYSKRDIPLAYWRSAGGMEVDFVLGEMDVAVEAKSSARITEKHFRGLAALADDQPVGRRILVCREPRPRLTGDGVEVLPAGDFVERLWAGDIA